MADLEVEYKDWHAIHDHMGKQLHVHGDCTIRGGGFVVTLEQRQEQSDPSKLLLTLVFVPTGESPSHQRADYRDAWDEGMSYKEVGFVVEGPVTASAPPTIPVEDVH
jgi:hypothetical protein